MQPIACKVLVLGGGPGGYVCAIRAGQLGLDTVLVESTALGGTCLNVGCIPSKAMIHVADEFARARHWAGSAAIGVRVRDASFDLPSAITWKDGLVSKLTTGVRSLLRRAGVRTVEGAGYLKDGKTCVVRTATGEQLVTAEHVVIATGSIASALPDLPFGGAVLSSSELLALTDMPRHLAVIGGGYIGLELGIAWRKLGAEVTVIEATDRLLPQYDAELTRPVASRMSRLGISIHLSTRATRFDATSGRLHVAQQDGKTMEIAADKVVVTVGRRANTQGWGLQELELEMSGPFIAIDEQCRTSMRNVWAIGDVTGEPMLAHRAMAQGEMVAEIMAGHRRAFDKVAIPAVCFTDPEIVSVGLSPDAARKSGHEVKVGSFPYAANGRAMTMESDQGFVRVVARADNHVVLGIQAVGVGVSELSASFALALEMGARLEDIAGTVHAHPTLSEALPEAAMKALGLALHA